MGSNDSINGNGHLPEAKVSANGLIPGATFPQNTAKTTSGHGREENTSSPLSFDGPTVNGQATKVSLYSPPQLARSSLILSMVDVINVAFARQEAKSLQLIPSTNKRLQYNGQLFDELGNAPGTFTYIIYYAGTDTVIATASGKRYYGGEMTVVQKASAEKGGKGTTFKRLGPVPEGTEAWELSTMAVDPALQRQGLAGYLMRMTEEEVARRFRAAHGKDGMKLVMMLTTIMEVNGEFYAKRGFVKDYEVKYDVGHLGSETGFSVVHMSKVIEADKLPS